MLPFLKNREGSSSAPVETLEREPDEEAEYDMLDAVCEDILAAVKADDKAMLKSALEAFVAHIQQADMEQDATELEEMP